MHLAEAQAEEEFNAWLEEIFFFNKDQNLNLKEKHKKKLNQML